MPKTQKNIVDRMLEADAGRELERLAMKYEAMRNDPFAFFRGTARIFYADLPRGKLIMHAPRTWLCGDLHLENFGSYRGDNGLVYFDVNDFDDCTLGPVSWDLLRFVTSVLVAAEVREIARPRAIALCHAFLRAYAKEVRDGKALWVERDTARGPVRELLDAARVRKHKDLLDRRTVSQGARRKIRMEPGRAISASREQRTYVQALLEGFAKDIENAGYFRVIDVARRVTGLASLGVERYVVLVEGEGGSDGNRLLDLKQAVTPSAVALGKWKQPKWKRQADRVVETQYRMQAVSKADLYAVSGSKRSYVLSELQPSEDRLKLKAIAGEGAELESTIATLARVVAWAHLRGCGRDGAASAQALGEFWSKPGRRRKVLQLAVDCATRTRRQWEAYCREYDLRSKAVADAPRQAAPRAPGRTRTTRAVPRAARKKTN